MLQETPQQVILQGAQTPLLAGRLPPFTEDVQVLALMTKRRCDCRLDRPICDSFCLAALQDSSIQGMLAKASAPSYNTAPPSGPQSPTDPDFLIAVLWGALMPRPARSTFRQQSGCLHPVQQGQGFLLPLSLCFLIYLFFCNLMYSNLLYSKVFFLI